MIVKMNLRFLLKKIEYDEAFPSKDLLHLLKAVKRKYLSNNIHMTKSNNGMNK